MNEWFEKKIAGKFLLKEGEHRGTRRGQRAAEECRMFNNINAD